MCLACISTRAIIGSLDEDSGGVSGWASDSGEREE